MIISLLVLTSAVLAKGLLKDVQVLTIDIPYTNAVAVKGDWSIKDQGYWSNVIGSQLKFVFKGTKVMVIGSINDGHGSLQITIDNDLLDIFYNLLYCIEKKFNSIKSKYSCNL